MSTIETASPKIFCIGFQKTGTTSLDLALQQLGYSTITVFGRDRPLPELRANLVDIGIGIAQGVDVVSDMPWPLIYRELDTAFPGAKFILTVRDTDKWYRSIRDHFGPANDRIQQLTYGDDAGSPVGNEARYTAVYDAHNADVRSYFVDRPDDFLEMSLEAGDGWRKLGAFIGRTDVPEGEFVRTNTASQRSSILTRTRKFVHRVKPRLSSSV
ncbi:sulfotransferase family protein [Aurantiacibacter zhengii]|uniref:sulfotransferase family protein n=1 Tax=Aurantiacibacter zhengii TaxID=2307003 RepID=UPI0011C21EE8|nr:sulfotransferase family protein [Aurantiacibacter zhengii]